MTRYIIKRVLLFLPTIFLVSWLAFYLSKRVPTDPVETILLLQGMEDSNDNYQSVYTAKYRDLNLDLQECYFSILPNYKTWISSDKINPQELEFINRWADEKYTQSYILEIINTVKPLSKKQIRTLLAVNNPDHLKSKLQSIKTGIPEDIISKINSLITNAESYKHRWHYPAFRWNGMKNQYHYWIGNMIKMEFGNSYIDARPIADKISEALKWTLTFVFSSLFLSFLVSFPIGVYNGMHAKTRFDNWTNGILFAIYSVPKFWLATIFILFFTTIEYGSWTNIFPNVGIWYTDTSQSFGSMILGSWKQLILPILVASLPDIAYLSRLIRSSILNEKSKEYIKTAQSKGLSKIQITTQHILPNSLSPTITLLAGVIPGALASSLVIEVIFNIPGIGRLMYDGIKNADWAVVFPILFLISVITVFIFLLADICIAWLNPKINFDS